MGVVPDADKRRGGLALGDVTHKKELPAVAGVGGRSDWMRDRDLMAGEGCVER